MCNFWCLGSRTVSGFHDSTCRVTLCCSDIFCEVESCFSKQMFEFINVLKWEIRGERIVGGVLVSCGSGILVRTPPGRLPLEVYRADPEPAGGIIDLVWPGNASGSPRRSWNVLLGNKKSRIFSKPPACSTPDKNKLSGRMESFMCAALRSLLRVFSYRFI